MVPFGIDVDACKPLELRFLGRKIKMQPDAGPRLLRHARKAHLVLVVGGLLGVVGIVVVDAAIDVEEFGPGQERFELVQNEAILARGLIGGLAFGADGPLLLVVRRWRIRALRIVAIAIDLGPRCHRPDIGPKRNRHVGLIAPRRCERHEFGPMGCEQRPRLRQQGCPMGGAAPSR